jgi:hypothetical protein
VIQRIAAVGAWAQLPRDLAQLTCVAIAPVAGPREAAEIVEGLEAHRDAEPPA